MTFTDRVLPGRPAPDAPTAVWLRWADDVPLSRVLGMTCLTLDAQEATLRVPVVPLAPNPNGSVNGGLVATLADLTMGVIAMRGAAPGRVPATATLSTQFHLPSYAPLTLRSRVAGGGGRLRFVEVVTLDRDGRVSAVSQGTMTLSAAAPVA